MGIIAAALIAAHSEGVGMGINSINDLPDWVAFSCFTAISLGTMSGGWKIVKTMGTKITKVTPFGGGCCGNCWRIYIVSDRIFENTCKYNPHHYRSYYRGWALLSVFQPSGGE